MKVCSRARLPVGVDPTNGPSPRSVCQIVSEAMSAVAVAAPRGPNRTAAHTTTGKTAYTYVSGLRSSSVVKSTSTRTRAPASGHRPRGQSARAQVSSRGATSKSPRASPDHHTSQRDPTALRSTTPLAHRLVTPSVALSVVLASAARVTKTSTSRSRSSAGRKPATRWSSQAAVTASRVFPTAMPAAPSNGTPAVQLSRKAPSAIPGQ